MTLYAFILDGVPGYRTTLEQAQAAVEEHYIDKGYSHLEWGKDGGERYGAHLWDDNAGWDQPAPHEPRLIWPWDNVGPSTDVSTSTEGHAGLGPLELCEAELIMTVRTRKGKTEFLRCYGETDWNEDRIRPHLVTTFAVHAGNELAKHLSKEGS